MIKRNITICWVLVLSISIMAVAEPSREVTIEEASRVAQNWIQSLLYHQQHWGGATEAQPERVEPLMRKNRLLGYYVSVHPQGYIIVASRKEFAPIKCFSETSDFDPSSDKGFADVIKAGLGKNLDALVEHVNEKALSNIEKHTEKYATTWNDLESSPKVFASALETQKTDLLAIIQRGPLLTSNWHQNEPYNNLCPPQSCGNSNGRALVGCVATAAAQVMNYWNWPPYGTDSEFEWANIFDKYIYDNGQWKTPDGTILTPQQLDAVALLCYMVGADAGADYGCDETSAWLGSKPGPDMTDAFKDSFRYDSDVTYEIRDFESASSWYYGIRADINLNGPLVYGIQTSWTFGGHAMVCDGWRENGSLQMIHLNYGWGGSTDGWYSLDEVPNSYAQSTESVIQTIRPVVSIGPTVSGTYPTQAFPYRYFNEDARGQNATFTSGQFLQFLPNRKVVCDGATGTERISFQGIAPLTTRLFTRGDSSIGVRIDKGSIRLFNGGGISFPE